MRDTPKGVCHACHAPVFAARECGDVAPTYASSAVAPARTIKSAVIGGVGQGSLSLRETWMLPRVLPGGLPITGNAHRLVSLVYVPEI
jgi:hypothetical protein